MALTSEQWDKINEATQAIRAMGCAVCVFTPDDVESQAEVNGGEAPADWLAENRKHIEDGMATHGNQYIADNL